MGIVSLPLLSALRKLEDELFPLVPVPCTQRAISASPGSVVPALRFILNQYTLQHNEHSVVTSGMSLKGQLFKKSLQTKLPKLFALYPVPSMKWRFVDLNAKALQVLVSVPSTESDYEGNMNTFDYCFNLDRYGFKR